MVGVIGDHNQPSRNSMGGNENIQSSNHLPLVLHMLADSCLWLLIHVLYLVGFRNRLSVMSQWVWSYLFSKHGSRLITHSRWENNQTEGAFRVLPFKRPMPEALCLELERRTFGNCLGDRRSLNMHSLPIQTGDSLCFFR